MSFDVMRRALELQQRTKALRAAEKPSGLVEKLSECAAIAGPFEYTCMPIEGTISTSLTSLEAANALYPNMAHQMCYTFDATWTKDDQEAFAKYLAGDTDEELKSLG